MQYTTGRPHPKTRATKRLHRNPITKQLVGTGCGQNLKTKHWQEQMMNWQVYPPGGLPPYFMGWLWQSMGRQVKIIAESSILPIIDQSGGGGRRGKSGRWCIGEKVRFCPRAVRRSKEISLDMSNKRWGMHTCVIQVFSNWQLWVICACLNACPGNKIY